MQETGQCRFNKKAALLFVKVGNRLEALEYIAAGMALILFVGIIGLTVVCREFFTPIAWGEEVSRFGYLWAVFLGSGIAIRRGTHFTIDIMSGCFRNTLKKIIDFLNRVVILVFVSTIFYYGVRFSIMSMERVSFPSGIRLVYSTVCIPIGAFFMLYYIIESFALWMAGMTLEEARQAIEEGSK